MAIAEPFLIQPDRRRRIAIKLGATQHLTLLDRVGIAAMVVVTIVAVFAPAIAPHNPTQDVFDSFLKPGSPGHLLGTDDVGRDILSRVIVGVQSSWLSAFAVIASGLVIGGIIGLLAGGLGGWIDTVLMRFTDIFLALPGPVLAITVVAALGPSLQHTLIAVAVVWWPFYARIVRGEVRALAARPHVEAAKLAGTSKTRLLWRHLLPGAVPSLIITASLDVSALVLTLASLSFLGLGAPAPAPELGAMSFRGLTYLIDYWWVPIMPALAVFVLALVANLAGDGIRDLIGDR